MASRIKYQDNKGDKTRRPEKIRREAKNELKREGNGS